MMKYFKIIITTMILFTASILGCDDDTSKQLEMSDSGKIENVEISPHSIDSVLSLSISSDTIGLSNLARRALALDMESKNPTNMMKRLFIISKVKDPKLINNEIEYAQLIDSYTQPLYKTALGITYIMIGDTTTGIKVLEESKMLYETKDSYLDNLDYYINMRLISRNPDSAISNMYNRSDLNDRLLGFYKNIITLTNRDNYLYLVNNLETK